MKTKGRTILAAVNLAAAVSVLGAMCHLLVHFSDYVYKFHSLSFFQQTWEYLSDCLKQPAGFLQYAARFLTQFCLYPGVAIAMLLAIYAAISFLICRLLLKDPRLFALSLLPPLGLFLFTMRLGYEFFLLKTDALIFSQPLGLLTSLLVFWLLRKRKAPFVIVAGVLLYPLFGFYALLPLLMCALSRKAPISSLATAALAPLAYNLLVFNRGMLRYAWLEGLPYVDFSGRFELLVPLIVALSLTLLYSLMRVSEDVKVHWLHMLSSAVIAAACVVCVYVLPNRDSLFHTQMRVERLIGQDRWESVLSMTRGLPVSNDVLIAYRNCALYATGRLAAECWKYPSETVPISSGETICPSSRVAGPTIFFHSGLINYAARWASELNLYSSYGVERVKYLALAALYNGETELARKYMSAVGRTTLHQDWARRYMACLDNPSLLDDDPVYARLKPLQDYETTRWMPSDRAAYDVILFYSFTTGRSHQMLEWNIATALLSKAGDYFEQIYPEYSATGDVPDAVRGAHQFFRSLTPVGMDNPDAYPYFYYNGQFPIPN